VSEPNRPPPVHLRLSVTDRCNLRCFYCMPSRGVPEVPHHRLLSLEELGFLAGVIHRALNLEKIRITGGEPLVRRGVAALLPMLPGVPDLAMTTNGVLLCEMAAELARAGLSRVNISLDSLDDSVLRRITRRDVTLSMVENAVKSALHNGLAPVKINCVALRGVNDGELGRIAEWGAGLGAHVRFIEHMPRAVPKAGGETVLRDEIAALAGGGKPLGREGTEETWMRSDGVRFGIIAPVSGHLCRTCRRVRLTAQGMFLPCLSGVGAEDLKTPLHEGASLEELARLVVSATERKHERGFCHSLPMWRIGG